MLSTIPLCAACVQRLQEGLGFRALVCAGRARLWASDHFPGKYPQEASLNRGKLWSAGLPDASALIGFREAAKAPPPAHLLRSAAPRAPSATGKNLTLNPNPSPKEDP